MKGWAFSIALGICVVAGAARAVDASSVPPPLVSHHQHLVSPAVAAMWSEPELPPIALPGPFAELLTERERLFGDAAALADLYTEDALLLNSSEPGWVRGRASVARKAAGIFSRSFTIKPAAFGEHGDDGHVAAYLTRGTGAAARPFGQAYLALKRRPDGTWRIAAETFVFPGPERFEPMNADALVAQLDAAGIRRAVVLSTAYTFGDPRRQVENEYGRVRAENDWTIAQAARHPTRLVAFCGLSPLRPYALEELKRCAAIPSVSGVKLHLGNSGVDLRNPDHVAAVRQVFRAANAARLPIVVHMKTRGQAYGRKDAEIVLADILPAAPDIPIQIAHMAGSGPGYPVFADEAAAVFAEAVAAKDPRVRNLYFDVTTVVTPQTSTETAEKLVKRMRQVGLERILFGADLATAGASGNPPPREAWAIFRVMLPLTDDEFRTIAGNVAPYLR